MEPTNQRRQILYREFPIRYKVCASDKLTAPAGSHGPVPLVMLLHGFTEDNRIWEKIVPALAEKYRLVLPDLPGSGESPANPQLKTLEDFAAALDAVRKAEDAEQVILIGHSMGGYLSLAFAALFPGRVAGLGLFHSTARPDSPEKKAAREKNQDFIRRNDAALFVRQSLPGLYSAGFRERRPEEMEQQISRYANFSAEILVLYLEMMKHRPDRTEILRSAGVPVLIIMGEEDKVVPPAEVLDQCHLARISYFHILPRTAHMGMVENPTLCISLLDRFLDQFTW